MASVTRRSTRWNPPDSACRIDWASSMLHRKYRQAIFCSRHHQEIIPQASDERLLLLTRAILQPKKSESHARNSHNSSPRIAHRAPVMSDAPDNKARPVHEPEMNSRQVFTDHP